LGTGAARLLVKSFATATSAANGNAMCGFAAPAVLGAGMVAGAPGGPGTLTFTVNPPCAIGPLPAGFTLAQNCLGTQTKASGTVTVGGTKVVRGIVTGMANPPILPVSPDAGTFNLTTMNFNTFELYDQLLDGGTPSRSTITGNGSVVVQPVAGQSDAGAGAPIVYTITTPVAGIEGLTMATGNITLVSDGNTFNVDLTNVSLNAFNGSHGGRTNSLSGSLTVDGQPVMIAPNTPLDPAFNQATFNASYVCAPGLLGPVAP
ncbi:MAG: hypothetical protein JNK82_38750, partial [Myxococcaceae bacterium]|nr:hypothetical protein [Myxococcaceae bacterium]